MSNKTHYYLEFHENLTHEMPKLLKALRSLRDECDGYSIGFASKGLRNLYESYAGNYRNLSKGIVSDGVNVERSGLPWEQKSLDIGRIESAIDTVVKDLGRAFEGLTGGSVDYSKEGSRLVWNRDRVDEQLLGKKSGDSDIHVALDEARSLYRNIVDWEDGKESAAGSGGAWDDVEALRVVLFDFIREMDNTLSGAELGMTAELEAYWRQAAGDGSYSGGSLESASGSEASMSYAEYCDAIKEVEDELKQCSTTEIERIGTLSKMLDDLQRRRYLLGAALNLQNEPYHVQTGIDKAKKYVSQSMSTKETEVIDIEKLTTIGSLNEAIKELKTQQSSASRANIMEVSQEILALEKKRDALTRLVSIPSMQQEVGELEGLKGKKLRLELEAIGLDGIKNKIRDLQKMLDDTKNPLGDEERKNVMGLVSAYKSYENALKKSQVKLQDAWGSIKGIGNGVENITDALEGNGNAWQKVTAIIDGVIQMYEGFNTIISIIQTLTAISTAHAAAKTVEATTETTESATLAENATVAVSAAAATTAANALATASWSALAAAMTFAAHAEIPFAGTAIAAGFVATQQAIIAACSIPKFANGAIAYGPTLGLFGEYSGASTNPEVVAPLDKLQSLLDIQGGGIQGGKVKFKIKGRSLEGVLAKEDRIRSRR